MNKTFVCIALAMALLTGCSSEPEQYQKATGEVVSKHISGGKFGDSYYVGISYPIGGNKFAIDDINVGDKSNFDSYNIKDKVAVYVNENGIGEITK